MSFARLVQVAVAVKPIVEVFAFFTTPCAALWTIYTYWRSVKLERAKWIRDLYEKFYEHDELKKIRDLLDSTDLQQIHAKVAKEESGFTDYLNFFEFLGYLRESKQISKEEILGLFDYYLKSLKKNRDISDYIADPTRGFEKLQKLLTIVEG